MTTSLKRKFGNNVVLCILEEIDTEEEMLMAFGDGEADHAGCYAETLEDFVGTALHLIQQGMGYVYINGIQIYANHIQDTTGEPIDIEDLDVVVSFSDLLKE